MITNDDNGYSVRDTGLQLQDPDLTVCGYDTKLDFQRKMVLEEKK